MSKLLFLLACFFSLTLWSQQYNFINYSLDDGLASSQVTEIGQGHLGYLWVGTQSGLSRFDGIEFVNYSIDDGLPDNKIEKLFFDDDNIMWVATPQGVGKFKNDNFIPYYFPEDHNIDTRINGICMFREQIYVASDSGLICLIDGTFRRLNKNDEQKLKIRAVVNHNDEKLICGSSKGLFLWEDEIFKKIEHDLLDTLNISDMVLLGDQLHLSTYGHGIVRYDLKTGDIDVFTNLSRNVRTVFADDEVILGATRNGAVEITKDYSFYYKESNGLLNGNLKTAFRDSEGNIWLGTDGNGLLKSSGRSVILYFEEDGLSSNLVMAINQLRDSTYVFGTYNAGLTMLKKDGSFEYIKSTDGLKDNQVWNVEVNKNQNCIVGTSGGVDYIVHGEVGDYNALSQIRAKTRSILEIESGNVIVGGSNGLIAYNYSKDSLESYPGKAQLDINKLVAKGNKIFIGSGSGLYVLNVKKLNSSLRKIDLPEDDIQTLCLDKNDNLWIGTINGLFYYPGEEVIPVILDEKEFRSKNIVALINDHQGNIWVSTYNGVYQLSSLDMENYEYELLHYGLAEGMVHLEGNQNALFEDYDYNIWVGTSGGLSRIDPGQNERLFDFEKPHLHIRGMRLFMEEFDYDQYESKTGKNTGVPKSITLPYNKNHITFDFIGINFKDPKAVRYSYRLVGVSDAWSPLSESDYATYSFIAPGEYTFEVMAANRNLEWSEVHSIDVIILPPFWQTWWFILLVILIVFIVIVLIFQVRIRAFKQKQENERLSFKNRLLFLEQRSLNASMNRHFIFNSLNSIQYFINSSDKRSANKYLSSFAKLIRKNLDSSTANNFVVSLQEEIERIELYLALEKMRFHDKFDFEVKVSPDLDVEEVEIPSMIMQPFVENSIIHGVLPLDRNGKITVNIYRDTNEQIVFEIADDGIGIDISLGKKNKQSAEGDHESKGMEITNRRIELLQKLTGENLSIEGPFQVNDENGKCLGSKVIIRIGVQNHTSNVDLIEDKS